MAKSNALELSIRIAGKVDSSLTKAIKTAQSQTSGLARGMSTFAKTSAAALVGVTTAVTGVMGYCGKQAADLERAMAQTRTLLTGTTEQTAARTAELTQDVMNISRVTPEQVAKVVGDTLEIQKIKENQNNVKLTATADAQGVVTLSLGGRTAWKT